jgi:tetratricopeptide (TPR) repeat protein
MKIKYIITLILLIIFWGCSSKIKVSQEDTTYDYYSILEDYFHNIDQKKYKEAFKFIADAVKEKIMITDFENYFKESTITQCKNKKFNILHSDLDLELLKHVEVEFDFFDSTATEANKGYRYYTLILENDKWKILWLNSLIIEAEDLALHGEYKLAYKKYLQLIKINPYLAYAYNGMAWINFRTKTDIDTAIQNIRRAIKLEPKYPHYYNTLASLYNESKKFKLTIQNFKKSYKYSYKSSQKATALFNIFVVNNYHFSKDSAKIYINRAIQLDSTNSLYLYSMANLFSEENDIFKADNWYKKSILNIKKSDELFQNAMIYYKYSHFISQNFDYVNDSVEGQQNYLAKGRELILKALEIKPKREEYKQLLNYYEMLL